MWGGLRVAQARGGAPSRNGGARSLRPPQRRLPKTARPALPLTPHPTPSVIPHRSLVNTSDHIRWSLDLRWQDAAAPDGFYGLKAPILLAPAAPPVGWAPDWAAWGRAPTSPAATAAALADPEVAAELAKATAAPAGAGAAPTGGDPFETAIAGPWMSRWAIVHHNRHTALHAAAAATGGSTWHGLAAGGAFG